MFEDMPRVLTVGECQTVLNIRLKLFQQFRFESKNPTYFSRWSMSNTTAKYWRRQGLESQNFKIKNE